MKLKTTSLMIAGTLFGAAMMPAQADPMLDLLKVLRDKGTISAEDYSLLANAAKAKEEKAEAEKTEMVEKVSAVEKKSSSVSLSDRGLRFESADKAFTAQVGGRIHADYAFVDDDVFEGTSAEVGNGAKFRRARLGMKGTMFNDWTYGLEVNFAGDNKNEFTDVFLGYKGFENVEFKLGRHKMPVGLEELTSSNNITFMERSTATNVFALSRRDGLTVSTRGDNWTLTGGAYLGDGVSDSASNGKDTDYGYGARVTFAPLSEAGKVVHFGASFQHEEFEKKFSDDSYNTQRLRARPEIHFFDTRPIDVSYADTKNANTYGLEAATVLGPFSLQGEYFNKRLSRDSAKNASVDGYYIQGSYALTGESRSYSNGAFGGIKPKNAVNQGGIGAWELALRYSDIDLLDNGTGATGNVGTEGDIFTIGLNWYATNNIRFMANYVNADIERNFPGDKSSDDIKAFMFRGQVAF